MISVVPVFKLIVCRKAPFPLVVERDQLEYTAPEILFTSPNPYPTCAWISGAVYSKWSVERSVFVASWHIR